MLQPDGRIVVAAGICQKVTPAADADICVARYLPEGQTDASFGSNGVAIIYPTSPSATLQEAAFALAMQPGGRLLVAAACGNTGTLSADACVIVLAGGPFGYRRCSLDLDGDNVARDTDALLFTRLMPGVSSNAAVQGINFPAAVRNSAALIRRHAIEQCGFSVAPGRKDIAMMKPTMRSRPPTVAPPVTNYRHAGGRFEWCGALACPASWTPHLVVADG